jgi:hypothetical protein
MTPTEQQIFDFADQCLERTYRQGPYMSGENIGMVFTNISRDIPGSTIKINARSHREGIVKAMQMMGVWP